MRWSWRNEGKGEDVLPEFFKGNGDFDPVGGLGRVEVYVGGFARGGGHAGGGDLIG